MLNGKTIADDVMTETQMNAIHGAHQLRCAAAEDMEKALEWLVAMPDSQKGLEFAKKVLKKARGEKDNA